MKDKSDTNNLIVQLIVFIICLVAVFVGFLILAEGHYALLFKFNYSYRLRGVPYSVFTLVAGVMLYFSARNIARIIRRKRRN